MATSPFDALRLDRGLTEVLHGGAPAGPAMPAQRQLVPAESLAAQHLAALLAPRSLAAELEAALQPPVDDRALLLPGAFRGALEAARDELAQAATTADAAARRLLNDALRALDDDLALRDLATMYRGVLHQG